MELLIVLFSLPEPVCPSGIKRFQFRAENVLLPPFYPPFTPTRIWKFTRSTRTTDLSLNTCQVAAMEAAPFTQTPEQFPNLRLSAQRQLNGRFNRDHLCSELICLRLTGSVWSF